MTHDGGDCTECGGSLLWGGMSWVEHTDAYHAMRRPYLLDWVLCALYEEIARRTGHRITIMFLPGASWAVCDCGWRGHTNGLSGISRSEGRIHMWDEGYEEHRGIQYRLGPGARPTDADVAAVLAEVAAGRVNRIRVRM